MNKLIVLLFFALPFLFLGCKNNKGVDVKFSYEIENGGNVYFKNNTSGLVSGYLWAFGDGNTSTEASPTHRYLKSGDYNVTLSVSGESGAGEKSELLSIIFDDFNPLEGHVSFEDADAIGYAINQYSYEKDDLGNTIESKFGQGVATFFDADNLLVSAGIVALNGIDLELGSNNAYSFSANDSDRFTADTLYYFTGDVNWSIYGGGGFPTVLQTTKQDFPAVSEIIKNNPATDPEEVATTVDYFVTTVNPIIGADSLIYQILDPTGEVLLQAILDDSQTSHTFVTSDLANLPKGELKLVVTAFNYEDYIFKGKKFYFVNESVVSRPIVIK